MLQIFLQLVLFTTCFISSQAALKLLLDMLPLEMQLEKTAIIQALTLKGQDNWPAQHIDSSKNLNFDTNQHIIDKIITDIFNNITPQSLDLTKPVSLLNKFPTSRVVTCDQLLN